MHTLYLGPSWAVQSYESPIGKHDPVKINLAQELQLTNYTVLAQYANGNLDQIRLAETFMEEHPELAPFNIVFVVGNSLRDGYIYSGVSQIEWAKIFLTSKDPIDLVQSEEQRFYRQVNSFGIPVALIGAHTDVSCESHDNITVIHPSWQNFLANQCVTNTPHIEPFYGWAADVAHTWLQGIVIPTVGPPVPFDLGGNPSVVVVDEITKIFEIWRKLENYKLFRGVHPNILGNQLFAKEIANSFNKWIDNVV
jgi:hypothetical protein